MATQKSLSSLEKSKKAVLVIKEKLLPVLEQLSDDKFGDATGRAQASLALSIGMMRYMGARLRGLDQGRKVDDPLRKDLNNIKRILANTKAAAGKKVDTETKKSKSQPLVDSQTTKGSDSQADDTDLKQTPEKVPKAQGEKESITSRKPKSHEKKRKKKSKESGQPGSASKKRRK